MPKPKNTKTLSLTSQKERAPKASPTQDVRLRTSPRSSAPTNWGSKVDLPRGEKEKILNTPLGGRPAPPKEKIYRF